MSDEKKDISDPRINYRNDWAENHAKRKNAANEKSNQAQGRNLGRVKDAESGQVKTIDEHLVQGKEREGKPMTEKLGRETAQVKQPPKDLHLKSTTSLTRPELAKQKGPLKSGNIESTKPPQSGLGGRSGTGGTMPMKSPTDILNERNDWLNPNDILSKKKTEKPFEVAMNVDQKPVKTSSFMTSLDAKIQKVAKNEPKAEYQKSNSEPGKSKQKGILAEIEKKVEAVKISTAKKSAQKLPKQEVAKQAPIKPIKRGR